MYQGYYKSPIGIIEITSEEQYITSVSFVAESKKENLNDVIIQCKNEIEEYFHKDRKEFDVKIKFKKGTEFQKSVWQALSKIPYGETVSYKYIAERINNPKAVRAVGGANNKNPIAIIIPCHRVVGTNGKMVGYESGIDKKEFLIELEAKDSNISVVVNEE